MTRSQYKIGTLDIALAICLAGMLVALPVFAQSPAASTEESTRERLGRFLDNDYYKIDVDMRMRIELGKAERLERSEAPTLRTRLGLGTKPFRGFSTFVEMENVVAMCDSCYFDVVEPPSGQTSVGDIEVTELNRAFLKYENDGEAPFTAIAGRQRIIFEDSRWVGNVGWRQNEQRARGECGSGCGTACSPRRFGRDAAR